MSTASAPEVNNNLPRIIDEIMRALDPLQTADQNACATPANWQKGEKVMVPPPQTIEDAEKRMQSDYEVTAGTTRSGACKAEKAVGSRQ